MTPFSPLVKPATPASPTGSGELGLSLLISESALRLVNATERMLAHLRRLK